MYFNLNLSGSASESKFFFGGEKSDKTISLAPSQLGYTKVISTEKRLHQSTFLLLPWIYSTKQASGNEETGDNTFQTSFRWERNDRFYKTGLWFLEFGNILDAAANRNTRKVPLTVIKNNKQEVKNTFTFGAGRGRIERVQDAQMALYILQDLETQGLLDAEVTPALSHSFARLITDINNRRVFDSRRRRIYELTRIDSFLRTSGLTNKTDIRHFTTVNDNWAFAINPYRLAGTAWFVRLKPGIAYSNSYMQRKSGSNVENKTDILRLSLSPETGFEKYIPVNLQWQQNLGASITY